MVDERRVTLVPEGLQLQDGSVVPLLAGTVHYWRLRPEDWRPCLEAVRDLGFRLVDLYVPWGVHEVRPGHLDLGGEDPRLDVVRFLQLVHELGLHAIVRPGPHINAELTFFGLPERIVWDPACQARSPEGNPVVLPMVPTMFPVPSYASEAYLDEATRYYHLLGEALSGLRHPDGPIVMVQIDNEGAMFFRDGPFDQDHHPDAIAKYREYLRRRYPTVDDLAAAYPHLAKGDEGLRFADVMPPRAFDVDEVAQLAHHLDWAAFQEELLARTLQRLGDALGAAGLGGLVTSHNFPLAQDRTPLNAARVDRCVDLVGFDYYSRASENDRRTMARRTSELAVRCEQRQVPAYACEMGAGYPPFFPPLSEHDSAFTVLCALAYGLRGFNVYMAVDRDRWLGAPIDPRGRPRPFAEFWRTLLEALDTSGFAKLRRRVPVRVVVPRIERRLARVAHAFGPASGPLLAVFGQGPRESCLEDRLDLGYPLAIEADTFVQSLEQALDARGVPFAVVGGEDRDIAFVGAQWVVCATSGGFADSLAEALGAALDRGARVTLGPHPRRFDGCMRPLTHDVLEGRINAVEATDPATADLLVARAMEELGLPSYASDPDPIQVTVHEDDAGEARVVFVINPSDDDLVARVTLGADASWRDPIDTLTTTSERGVLEVRVRPKTVRMLLRAGQGPEPSP